MFELSLLKTSVLENWYLQKTLLRITFTNIISENLCKEISYKICNLLHQELLQEKLYEWHPSLGNKNKQELDLQNWFQCFGHEQGTPTKGAQYN